MKFTRCLIYLSTLFFLLSLNTQATAAGLNKKCRVSFKIFNDRDARIKVRKINVIGNFGFTWNENIGNEVILPGNYALTNPRRLQKLDRGMTGTFKLRYQYRRNNKWYWYETTPQNWRCNVPTLDIHVTGNPISNSITF